MNPNREEALFALALEKPAAKRAAWLDALTIDPLLPARLLPANYLGQTAWRRRLHAMGKTARQTAAKK